MACCRPKARPTTPRGASTCVPRARAGWHRSRRWRGTDMDRANQRTLLLTRSDIAALLDMRACIDAVETAFRLHASGEIGSPGIVGMHVPGGGFHVKAAGMASYFAAKTNANFPRNPKAHGLPTIQGAILLFDAT